MKRNLFAPTDFGPDSIDVQVSELLVATSDQSDVELDHSIGEVLRLLRERLHMDVVFVSEFVDGQRVFRRVEQSPGVNVIAEGEGAPLEESWCQRVVDRRLPQYIADAKRVRHDRERGIHRAARGEEAPVHHVQIVHLVRPAGPVERRTAGVVAEADGPVLVGHPREWNALADEQVAGEQALMALMAVHRAGTLLIHQLLELPDEPLVAFLVVRPIRQHDAAVPVEGHAVVGIRQVLGREPEVE